MNHMRRTFDVIAALFGLIITAPIVAIAAAAIRIDSSGWPIFAQKRIGRHGTEFVCYKLRTMYMSTESLPTHSVAPNSVTSVGGWLRKWRVDELPQLYNVLLGEMSLVGPRPCLPTQHELIAARRKLGVLEARPGITGLAQVQGIDMSDPERLAEVDAVYTRSNSFLGDLKLIVSTVLGRGMGVDYVARGSASQ